MSMKLEYASVPHIYHRILSYADWTVLKTLRLTCKSLRDATLPFLGERLLLHSSLHAELWVTNLLNQRIPGLSVISLDRTKFAADLEQVLRYTKHTKVVELQGGFPDFDTCVAAPAFPNLDIYRVTPDPYLKTFVPYFPFKCKTLVIFYAEQLEIDSEDDPLRDMDLDTFKEMLFEDMQAMGEDISDEEIDDGGMDDVIVNSELGGGESSAQEESDEEDLDEEPTQSCDPGGEEPAQKPAVSLETPGETVPAPSAAMDEVKSDVDMVITQVNDHDSSNEGTLLPDTGKLAGAAAADETDSGSRVEKLQTTAESETTQPCDVDSTVDGSVKEGAAHELLAGDATTNAPPSYSTSPPRSDAEIKAAMRKRFSVPDGVTKIVVNMRGSDIPVADFFPSIFNFPDSVKDFVIVYPKYSAHERAGKFFVFFTHIVVMDTAELVGTDARYVLVGLDEASKGFDMRAAMRAHYMAQYHFDGDPTAGLLGTETPEAKKHKEEKIEELLSHVAVLTKDKYAAEVQDIDLEVVERLDGDEFDIDEWDF